MTELVPAGLSDQERATSPPHRPAMVEALASVARAASALLERRSDAELAAFKESLKHGATRERLLRQLENPELLDPGLWEEMMIDFLVNGTAEGTYCHEGEDLLTDFCEAWELPYPSSDIVDTLSYKVERIVDEFDRANCGFCEDSAGRDDDFDEQGGDDE